jgi:enamine deaminase RidA (YjgF/YER057c/UK114 family)
MERQTAFWIVCGAPLLLIFAGVLPAQRNKKKDEEPKTQVLALPPQLPMALAADRARLDFHISPLLTAGGLSAQIRHSLNDLIRDTRGETIVKLRAFVAGAGDARRVQSEVGDLFSEKKLPLPVLTVIQVGALGRETSQVVIEAVVATHRITNEAGLAYLAGQSGPSVPAALDKLKASAAAASLPPGNILSLTCFTSKLDNYAAVRQMAESAFPKTAINIVQALRDPLIEGSMCEAIGQLNAAPREGELVWLKNSRTTLVDTRQLTFTGLQLSFGNFLDDAQEAFTRLERAAWAIQPVQAPVQVNVFSVDASSGAAIRKRASVPLNVFTAETVEGLPAVDAFAGIEAAFAPNVSDPVTVSR